MAPILQESVIFGQPLVFFFFPPVDKKTTFNILLDIQKKPTRNGEKMTIKEYLKKHRMTLQEFAYESKIGTSTIQRLSKGAKVSKSIAKKIEEFTGGEIPYEEIVND